MASRAVDAGGGCRGARAISSPATRRWSIAASGDGIFINTAGIGVVSAPHPIGPASVRAGDAVLVSGDLGRHGMAIMAVRENLSFESTIESDCAPLVDAVMALIDDGIDIHCLRDLTRGGLASALVEIAEAARLSITVDESLMPVREDVRGACEVLGFDPLYVANEGRFVAVVAAADAERAAARLARVPQSAHARIVGSVRQAPAGLVTMKSLHRRHARRRHAQRRTTAAYLLTGDRSSFDRCVNATSSEHARRMASRSVRTAV